MFDNWPMFYQGVMAFSLLAGAVAIIWSAFKNKTGELNTKTIQEYKDAVQSRDLTIKDLEGQMKVLEIKVKNLEDLNTSLIDKAFNKELLMKMEQTLEKLSAVIVTSFVPLVQPGGFVSMVQRNHEEIMAELDDVHAAVVTRKLTPVTKSSK